MRTLVGGLAGTGRTVLVSSHDLSELEQVCDWLVLIDTGRSLYQGPTRDLLDGTVGALAVVPEPSIPLGSLHDVLRDRGHRSRFDDARLLVDTDGADVAAVAADVNRAAFDAGIVLVELSPLATTLEDRYLTLVQGGSR